MRAAFLCLLACAAWAVAEIPEEIGFAGRPAAMSLPARLVELSKEPGMEGAEKVFDLDSGSYLFAGFMALLQHPASEAEITAWLGEYKAYREREALFAEARRAALSR